mgnify:CR=1 FL=1
MGAWGIQHWLILLVIVLLLFGGGGKISSLMSDFGKGLRSFRKGMAEEEAANKPAEPKRVEVAAAEVIDEKSKAAH